MIQNNYNGALQKPIGSGFNAATISTEVIQGIDLTGKIAIVTGGLGQCCQLKKNQNTSRLFRGNL